MNIILKDGRKELYQWDTGRQIQFDDSAVGQAHFTNKLFGLVIVDGVAKRIKWRSIKVGDVGGN